MAQQSDYVTADVDTVSAERRQADRGALERAQLRSTPGFYHRAARRFLRNKVSVVGLIVTIVVLVLVLGAGLITHYITHYDYETVDFYGGQFLPPFSDGHVLGTDLNGRDELARLLYGGRVSLLVAGVAALATLGAGSAVGAIAGYFGGFIDTVLMRIVDVMLSVPGFSLLILIATLYSPGPVGLGLVIAFLGWPGVSRLIRGEVLGLRNRDFIDAARVTGASNARIIVRHVMPSVIPIIVVWISLAIPGLILTEAALSYLGFGVHIPTPSWGNMLSDAQGNYTQSWWNIFIPGMMIYITVLGINLVGNGLRDALDPRLSD